MTILPSALVVLAISAASVTSAQARDSFSLGINIGGYGYAPPVTYYPAPVYYGEPVYYNQPIEYYRPAPRYYSYAPRVVSFGYQSYGDNQYRGHHGGNYGGNYGGHHGWGHGDHHGGGHDGRHDGGQRRGHDDDD